MKKHLTTNIGSYGLTIKGKKVLLLHKPNDPIWCALGGRMEKKDSNPIKTLIRESKEEIGIEIQINEILDVKLWDIEGKNKRLGIFYLCKLKEEIENIKLSNEHDEFKLFTFNEALEMLKQKPRGKHGIELITLLKDKGYLK